MKYYVLDNQQQTICRAAGNNHVVVGHPGDGVANVSGSGAAATAKGSGAAGSRRGSGAAAATATAAVDRRRLAAVPSRCKRAPVPVPLAPSRPVFRP